MKRKNKQILYSVEVFLDEINFPKDFCAEFGHAQKTWNAGSPIPYSAALRLYKAYKPQYTVRIISSNGYVRMKSHK